MLTEIGTVCKIITQQGFSGGNESGHYFPFATKVRIIDHDGDDPNAPMKAEYLDGSNYWYVNEDDIEVIQ